MVEAFQSQLNEAVEAAAHPIPRPTTDAELEALTYQLLGVRIPNVQVCPQHVSPFRAFADAYFARTSVVVIEASRGLGGKSFMLAALGLMDAITLKSDVVILGGSYKQSVNIHKYMGRFWKHEGAPRHLLLNEPSKSITRLSPGNEVEAITASQRAARGPHPQRIILDEVDEMDESLREAAMGQTMERDGVDACTVLSSTHQNPDGPWTNVLAEAEVKGWPVYKWCYRESMALPHGWLRENEVARKRSDVTANTWDTEYELQEPTPEGRAILTGEVDKMFKRELGEYRGEESVPVVIEKPVEGGRYVVGGDWAKEKDWTVIRVLRVDVSPCRFVYYRRLGRMAWPVMVDAYDSAYRMYKAAGGAHDATGVGNVVTDLLTVLARGEVLVGKNRSGLLSEYIAAIENGKVEDAYIAYVYKEHKFATNDDVYGSGHLPDTICAGAMCWRAKKYMGWTRGS